MNKTVAFNSHVYPFVDCSFAKKEKEKKDKYINKNYKPWWILLFSKKKQQNPCLFHFSYLI